MISSRNQRGPLSEINVVPLVDIMLVLLIVFMIAAPMMQSGMPIDLPKVTTKPLPSKEDVQVLTITKDKGVILNEKKLEATDLKAAIQLLFTNKPDKEIFLRADSRVPYGFVVTCMGLIREAGVQKINIVTKNIDER